jgi:hypothetical protein
MSKFTDLKASILEDGIIDQEEVKQIAILIYEDGMVDEEEANFLFELNDAVSGRENHKSWNELFVKGIMDYLLHDLNSPGEIDDDEAKWLLAKIGEDGQVDAIEKQLLLKLQRSSKTFPESLRSLL